MEEYTNDAKFNEYLLPIEPSIRYVTPAKKHEKKHNTDNEHYPLDNYERDDQQDDYEEKEDPWVAYQEEKRQEEDILREDTYDEAREDYISEMTEAQDEQVYLEDTGWTED